MKESKEERFCRVAEARVEKIIKMIRLLGNCSMQNVYTYNSSQAEKIFITLQKELNKAKARYTNPSKSVRKRFSLGNTHTPEYLSHPHIRMHLPDGTELVAAAFTDLNNPAINIFWKSTDMEQECLVCFAEYNQGRVVGQNLCVGAYQSDSDDTKYYAPYHRRKGNQ